MITRAIFFAGACCALVLQTPPETHSPKAISRSFLLSAEEAIDDFQDASIGFGTSDFARKFEKAHDEAKALARETSSPDEEVAARKIADLDFAFEYCRIIERSRADTHDCEAGITAAIPEAMRALGRHKEHGVWKGGAPDTASQ